MTDYVHGYSEREADRLADQAQTLTDLLHHDTCYPDGSAVLEAGCGVGAQTAALATRSPGARFTCIDISPDSLRAAKERAEALGLTNATFQQADIAALPFADAAFDHVFVCFVLEHLPDPVGALRLLSRVLKPGGTLTAIEGDHGSAYFHPESADARRVIDCLARVQRESGADPMIGRRLYPLLREAGFADVHVSPRMVYVDSSRPDLVDGFTLKTFTAMVEGVREPALAAGLIDAAGFDAGIKALKRTAEADGTFCYTFFKALAIR
ncbi:MAG TPA: methyltransferase domain-containing protein [Armatimonadota bacterium]|jgi:ubiquinone/menaquinone biosynthesis C-methylase UbiE